MKNLKKDKTIAFYHVCESNPDGRIALRSHAPWQDILANWEELDHDDRAFSHLGLNYLATVQLHGGQRHLLLHRLKSDDEWLARIDWKSSEFIEIENLEEQGYVESSVVSFASFGNVLALMEGGISAPGRPAVEAWLRHIKPLTVDVAVDPLVAPGNQDAVTGAAALQSVEIKLGRVSSEQLKGRSGGLATLLKEGASYGGGAYTVTLRVQGPRGSSKALDRQAKESLLHDFEQVQDLLSLSDRARVGALFENGDKFTPQRIVDLVDHHITAKVRVETRDEAGQVIRLLGAMDAIANAIEDYNLELHACVSTLSG